MNTRLIFTAAALPADQARAIVELICAASPESAAMQRRNRLTRRFKNSLSRVLNFAKHETLRKAQRYLHSHRPLQAQDETVDHPDSIKVAFNPDELQQDLSTMLQGELPGALASVSQETLDALGYRDPWKLPAQDTLDFIARRQNLLSNVPDEIWQTIRDEISTGLNAGESIAQLSKRITAAFDEIEKGRAAVIAETESAAAYSFAGNEAAQAAGIQYKKWVHSSVPKEPRPDHLAIDGLIIPMDEAFPVGDPPLMYPHDGNGAAQDVINCYCISIPVTEAEYQAQQIKGSYDPNEPRDPAGTPTGGEWTSEGGSETLADGRPTPKTGKPFEFPFVHHTAKSGKYGARFGQDIEPAGRYLVDTGKPQTDLAKGLESGTKRFEKPLVIPFGGGYQDKTNWKNVLSQRYGGKTGLSLSKAIRADGYDGIVTIEKSYAGLNTSEIVDLSVIK